MMARILKEEVYFARRKEILDAAQRFVYTKGYEQMTIQDILSDLGISKGAFYHYFNSKGEVLEALVERMVAEDVLPIIIPIVQDPRLTAIEKMERYFDTGFSWKTAQKDFMLRLLKVWLADENAIVRQKMFSTSVRQITPSLAEIIRQGVQEGVFTTAYPDQLSHAIIYFLQGLGDTIIELLIANETNPDPQRIESTVTAYTNALSDTMERVLGTPSGSLKLIDPASLKEWFLPSEEAVPSPGLAAA
jgi:TetR/AcrR family transcriptional regulator, transcriptional repressor for nem operon